MNELVIKRYIYRDKCIEVIFKDQCYYEKVIKIFDSMHPVIQIGDANDIKYNLMIAQKEICCNINGNEGRFVNIESTDVYVITYLFLYSIWSDNDEFGIHSVAIEKNNVCSLIVGNFGSGKTSLAWQMNRLGWTVLSTDQSIIRFVDTSVYFIGGSRFDEKNIVLKNCERKNKIINNIIMLKGMAKSGDITINKSVNNPHNVKALWHSMTWPWNILLIGAIGQTEYFKKNYFDKISKFCNIYKRMIFWEVRGDPTNIAAVMDLILNP